MRLCPLVDPAAVLVLLSCLPALALAQGHEVVFARGTAQATAQELLVLPGTQAIYSSQELDRAGFSPDLLGAWGSDRDAWLRARGGVDFGTHLVAALTARFGGALEVTRVEQHAGSSMTVHYKRVSTPPGVQVAYQLVAIPKVGGAGQPLVYFREERVVPPGGGGTPPPPPPPGPAVTVRVEGHLIDWDRLAPFGSRTTYKITNMADLLRQRYGADRVEVMRRAFGGAVLSNLPVSESGVLSLLLTTRNQRDRDGALLAEGVATDLPPLERLEGDVAYDIVRNYAINGDLLLSEDLALITTPAIDYQFRAIPPAGDLFSQVEVVLDYLELTGVSRPGARVLLRTEPGRRPVRAILEGLRFARSSPRVPRPRPAMFVTISARAEDLPLVSVVATRAGIMKDMRYPAVQTRILAGERLDVVLPLHVTADGKVLVRYVQSRGAWNDGVSAPGLVPRDMLPAQLPTR